MLTSKTIDIIKSTVPVLEVHGQAITTTFYQMLFDNHPELLNIFNHVNQRQGKQPQALANTVYAAAVHIDNLEAILPVVKQISEKHRALNIQPEHYPIVGETLLAAMKQVLGDAATPEILNAWAEAYGIIADAFIGVEADMYETVENIPGGWLGFRKFVVDKKVKESDVITSFYLKPQDGKAIATYLPGQYITVRVKPEGEEYTHIRHYSLSKAAGDSSYRITVKKEAALADKPAGIVSTYLHDSLNEGDIVEVSAPAGSFTLDQSKDIPVVLLSGGVGITPMVSMLETILKEQPDRDVTFIHAAIHGGVHAMKEHIEQLDASHPHMKSYLCYELPRENDISHKTGYIDLAWLQEIVSPEADFYFCGPVSFMRAVNHALQELGVPAERIHYEFFGPADSLEA
ncbi:NO-inducible flavohemoprotein [Paenibacillus pini]|uniref:Flavohemoprotein n=1 Tax=Paenibacillus pini JCM 16418 TaxID=1236976 RepID=W7YHY6_9BACL|nr:NO-inducible flavohemoprotein [Paenibacillus pini]GAF07218.1 flavohemoprotein [Paenibacillus pini JCM 16418]